MISIQSDENAYDAAVLAHGRSNPARTFLEDLTLHLRHGYVVSIPGMFLMGRPVCKDAPYEQLTDITHRFESPDCWFVWLAAGPHPSVIVQCMPFHLPYVMWERNNRPRVYSTHRLIHALTTLKSIRP